MTGSWHGGKGSDPRPEGEPGAYARGFEAIDWTAREREQRFLKAVTDADGAVIPFDLPSDTMEQL